MHQSFNFFFFFSISIFNFYPSYLGENRGREGSVWEKMLPALSGYENDIS